jgi:hypothetical protein
VWLHLFSEAVDVLLVQLSYRDVGHLDGIVEFLFSQLDFKLFVLLIISRCLIFILRSVHQAKLLGHVWVIQEVVEPENSFLVILILYFLVWYYISWVDLGRHIDSIILIARSISVATKLVALCQGVALQSLLCLVCFPEWDLGKRYLLLVSLDLVLLLLQENLLLCLENSLMQNLKEVLASLQDVLVYLLRVRAWHPLVPQVDDDQDVLDAHLLELQEQLLTASLLVAIVKPFGDAFIFNSLQTLPAVRVVDTHLRVAAVFLSTADPVRHDARFGLLDLLPPLDEVHDHVNMHFLADGCGESLVSYFVLDDLLPETDRVDDTFHLIHLFKAQVLFLASDVLVVSWAVLHLVSTIVFDVVSVLKGVLPAELEDEVLLTLVRK